MAIWRTTANSKKLYNYFSQGSLCYVTGWRGLVGRVRSSGEVKPRLHDTTCCQTGCTTGLITGCIVYTNI